MPGRARSRGPWSALAYALLGFGAALGMGVYGAWVSPWLPRLVAHDARPPIDRIVSWWPEIATVAYSALAFYLGGNAMAEYARWYYGWDPGDPTATLPPVFRGTSSDGEPPLLLFAGGAICRLSVVVLAIAVLGLGLITVLSHGVPAPWPPARP